VEKEGGRKNKEKNVPYFPGETVFSVAREKGGKKGSMTLNALPPGLVCPILFALKKRLILL